MSARKRAIGTLAGLLLIILLTALLLAAPALARVGGGGSYSGGSFSGGGGGGGGGGGLALYYLFDTLFQLIIFYPFIGIPLTIAIIIFALKMDTRKQGSSYASGSSQNEASRQYPGLFHNIASAQTLEMLQKLDTNFSKSLFMDFAYSLFSTLHMSRGKHRSRDLSAYFSDTVLAEIDKISQGVTDVQGVIVGAAHIKSIRIQDKVQIVVEFEANYTETLAGKGDQSWYTQESWTFVRDQSVVSKPPEKILALSCPACGAPLGNSPEGKCPACGKRGDAGQFDWFVQYRSETREERPPLLTTEVPEEGTDLPTLLDPDLSEEVEELKAKHPDFSWPAFSARLALTFTELQQAWTLKRWDRARPYESDRLFQTHLYWIAAYQKQALTNVLKDIKIEKTVAVKVLQDHFYSSITVRIYASMIDYTAKPSGEIVCGSARRPRPFSEYWTFIRTHEAATPKGAPNQCPACGAELKINMAGICEFCQTKITSGNFDWVLSEIEQDESYAG